MDRHLLRAESEIRELACHHLGGRLLAPLLYAQLKAVLPYSVCGYAWLGPEGPTGASFSDNRVGPIVRRYSEAYFRSRERDVWMTIDEAATAHMGPHHFRDGLRVPVSEYYRHPIYNEIARPAGLHNFIRFVVADQGHPTGYMMLGRATGERDFDDNDVHRLRQLAPFIAAAMNSSPAPDQVDDCAQDTAMLIVDCRAQVRWASPEAHRLFWLAAGRSPPTPGWPQLPALAVSTLAQIRDGAMRAVPPYLRRSNAWGGFAIRAYWLTPDEPHTSLIGLTIEHRVPRALRALSVLLDLHLPPQQVAVGVRIALGLSDEHVAQLLGISKNTVVYHRRQIYNRLGVSSRQELARRLFNTT